MSSEYYDPRFYGTTYWWKHPHGFLIVDSVKHFCEERRAWWTLDVIGSYRYDHPFLVIQFDVADGSCLYTAREDSGLPPISTQHIPYTDLDVSIQLYWESGVLLFPSDH
jgi:hypothetical protein